MATPTSSPESYPARLEIDYPDKLDRLTTLFRLIWAIPILIILGLLTATGNETVIRETGEEIRRSGGGISGGLFVATVLMIVFRMRYPRWWFDFARELARFSARVGAYLALLTDHYPSTVEEQSIHLEIDYPDVEPQPLASAGQVAPRDPSLHRVGISGAGQHRRDRDRLVRDHLHRTLPKGAVRLRGGCWPMGTSCAGLRLPPRYRPIPAVQPQLITHRSSRPCDASEASLAKGLSDETDGDVEVLDAISMRNFVSREHSEDLLCSINCVT